MITSRISLQKFARHWIWSLVTCHGSVHMELVDRICSQSWADGSIDWCFVKIQILRTKYVRLWLAIIEAFQSMHYLPQQEVCLPLVSLRGLDRPPSVACINRSTDRRWKRLVTSYEGRYFTIVKYYIKWTIFYKKQYNQSLFNNITKDEANMTKWNVNIRLEII